VQRDRLLVAIIASVAAFLVDRARRAEMTARREATHSLAAEQAAKAAADANLKEAIANLGLARRAVDEYFTRVSQPLSRPFPDELYQLALSHALSAYLDSPASEPTTPEDGASRAAHADRAVLVLRRATEGGYRDLAALENDPGWHPIRHRADVQMLFRDLAFPVDAFAR
jgi:hypothetical protein